MKTFEYKYSSINKNYTVRTKGIILKESRSCKCFHRESETGKYNVYTVTESILNKLKDEYWDFIPQFGWTGK